MATPYYNAGYPVVVQGQPVSNAGYGGESNYYHQSAPSSQNHHVVAGTVVGMDSSLLTMDAETGRGTPQPKRCRDVFWGILFYAHLGAIVCLAAIYTPQMAEVLANSQSSDNGGRRLVTAVWSWCSIQYQAVPIHFRRYLQESDSSSSTDEVSFNVSAILVVLSICGLIGLVTSSIALVAIMNFAAGLIKAALVSHVVFLVALAALALLGGSTGLCILLFIGAGLSLCFTVSAWSRIPFGAANLTTAVTAVRANIGLAFFAYLSLVLSFIWSIVWSLASVSTVFILNECDASFQCTSESPTGTLVLFLFLLSYHWASQVIFNVVHVTTAGTVGTWWFAPQEANSCCSKAVGESYIRAMTWSFGSICLGSLLVALIEATRDLLRNLREQNDSMLACLADCCLACIESWAEYFCKWAYVYVGLYGYGFIEASSNVINLFRARGWTTIITDTLVDTVLFMVALSVGAFTGIIALIIGVGLGGGQGGTAMIFFFIGFVVGWVMCATLFSIVSSAVNTVIVCYAEAPNEFQANHPQLSNHMREAWRQAWPVEFHY